MDGKEAQVAVSQLLLEKIRDDKYPSNTHMEMLEDSLPREMLDEYLEVLMDKVADEPYPSIDMLRRIQRVADSI